MLNYYIFVKRSSNKVRATFFVGKKVKLKWR